MFLHVCSKTRSQLIIVVIVECFPEGDSERLGASKGNWRSGAGFMLKNSNTTDFKPSFVSGLFSSIFWFELEKILFFWKRKVERKCKHRLVFGRGR